MWKRIQTLYLLISTGLIVSMLFSRFASIIGPGGEEAIIRYHEKMPYLVLLLMLTTSHIAATASFKTRFLQARVSIIAAQRIKESVRRPLFLNLMFSMPHLPLINCNRILPLYYFLLKLGFNE